ncbi:MAG: hypothetical protein AB8G26_04290 [Ilumatobacter sp.]
MSDLTTPRRFVDAEYPAELTGAALGEWLAAELGDLIRTCDGLFTATGRAGATESVDFWSEVTDRGARLANPRIFPWTLASAPSGHLAMTCDVRGPVIGFVGGADATDAAIESAIDHLDDQIVERAAVVAFDRVRGRTVAAALVVDALVADTPGRVICGAGDAIAPSRLTAVHGRSWARRIA